MFLYLACELLEDRHCVSSHLSAKVGGNLLLLFSFLNIRRACPQCFDDQIHSSHTPKAEMSKQAEHLFPRLWGGRIALSQISHFCLFASGKI